MKKLFVAAVAFGLTASVAAQAQGIVGGSQDGANQGNKAAGPIGAVVGGVVGGIAGGVSGLFGGDDRPKFREYVISRNHPVVAVTKPVVVGGLVDNTVTLYDIPPQYGIVKYKYAYINGRAVIVDPATYAVVDVID